MNMDLIRKMDRIHPYPAKFTIDLAFEYVSKFTKENDTVYDTFVGTGTTLWACRLHKRNGRGTDINHIAILIAEFKLLKLSEQNFLNLESFIREFNGAFLSEVQKITPYYYKSINHWFTDESIAILSVIKKMISVIDIENEKKFCELIFSSIINNASNQESDTRYAAIYKPRLNVHFIADLFINKFKSSLELYREFVKENKSINFNCKAILHDSKLCTQIITENFVYLILTSPPYPNTYDYYLYHKHRMNWLEFDVQYSMQSEIGSRREFSSLKRPIDKFDEDMAAILGECNKTLKLGGYAILVMGDGSIQGELYDAKKQMISVCEQFNWSLVDYSYTLLDDTSRSFQKSYRTKGKKEHILIFKKES